MTSFASPLFWQIQYLVTNLNKKNFKSNVAELNQLVGLYGDDARIFLLHCLIKDIELKDGKLIPQKDGFRVQILAHEMAQASSSPNFTTLVCKAFEGFPSEKCTSASRFDDGKLTEDLLCAFCKLLKLSIPQQITLAVALAQDENEAKQKAAMEFLESKILELPNCGAKLPSDVLHSVIYMMQTRKSAWGNGAKLEDFLNSIATAHPSDMASVEIASLTINSPFYVDCRAPDDADTLAELVAEIEKSCLFYELMEDIGYDCTSSESSFRALLSETCLQNTLVIPAAQIAGMLAMLSRTSDGLVSDNGATLMYQLASACDTPNVGGQSSAEDKDNITKGTWNLDVIASVLQQDYRNIKWPKVVDKLDREDLIIKSAKQLSYLIDAYQKCSLSQYPVLSLLRPWKHAKAHISVLKAAIELSHDILSFEDSPRKLAPFEGADASAVSKNGVWFSLDVVETLLSLSERDCYGEVRRIFDGAMKTCPDVLIANLAQAKPHWNNLRDDVFADIFALYIMGRANAPLIMRHLYSVAPKLVLYASVKCFYAATSPQIIPRLFALFRNTSDAFASAIHSNYFSFAISLAIIGANHDVLNLENWIVERLTTQRVAFATSCLAFAHRNYARAIPKSSITPQTSHILSIESLAIILKSILAMQAALTPAIAQELKRVVASAVEAHPSIAAGTKLQSEVAKPTESVKEAPSSFTPEMIEEQANAYFQQIYTSEQNINDVVAMLKRFQSSRDERERQIFFCMIHNLFDEYRFFPRYPEMELRITGVLFGKLIEHQVLPPSFLQTALRSVLESLREPVNSKYFFFGACALQQFVPRLCELPAYCTNLSQISHLQHALPEIMRQVNNVVRSVNVRVETEKSARSPIKEKVVQAIEIAEASPKISTPSKPNSEPRTQSPKSVASPATVQLPVMAVDHIFDAQSVADETEVLEQPEEDVKDRIHFIVNNMSISNLEAKIPEVRKMLLENFFPWMANYLVIKRISTQPNYHAVYLIFIEKLMRPQLEKEIMRRTLLNARKLITSTTITTNSQQRSLLKNLGLWLGLFTLSRNKPLLQRELDLKELLYVGYETGHLIAVTPFVAKILEGCKKSKIFKPPNPWVMGLIHAMREIYDVPDLKLNLKFEIEVLFKSFKLNVEDQCKAQHLHTRLAPPRTGNPDFNVKAVKAARSLTPTPSQKAVVPKQLIGTPSSSNKAGKCETYGTSPAGISNENLSSPSQSAAISESTVIPNLASYVSVNPDLPLQNVNLRRLVPLAVDRAIREVISPVVERSVTIACITTREIILKDFATEVDDVKMRKAAHLMVASMSGSLALITAKEPLRSSIGAHLRSLISASAGEPQQIEHVIQVCSNENTDLGCMLIEKASSEKAMRDIDEALAAAYTARRRYQQQPQSKETDTVHYFHGPAQQGSANLPDALKPKVGGIPNAQLVVYEAFQRIPRPTSLSISRAGYTPTATAAANVSLAKEEMKISNDGPASVASALERFGGLLEKLELFVQNVVRQAAANQREIPSFASIPPESELFVVLREVRSVCTRVKAPHRDEAYVKIGQRIVKCMYQLGNGRGDELLLEVLTSSLSALHPDNEKLRKELASWILRVNVEDKLKLHSEVILSLVRFRLVDLAEFDAYLTRNMERNGVGTEFAVHIVRQCLPMEHVKLAKQLPSTLDTLTRIIERHANPSNKNVQILSSLVQQAKAETPPARISKPGVALSSTSLANLDTVSGIDGVPTKAVHQAAFKHTVSNALEHWIAIYKEPASNQKVLAQYVQMLRQCGLLNDDECISLFFKISTEMCVEACIRNAHSSDKHDVSDTVKPQYNYGIVDALTHLMGLLIKYLDASATVKLQILNHAIGAIANALVTAHDTARKKKTKFDQRVYFRLFVNLMEEVTVQETVLEPIHLQILNTFARAYNSLQPIVLPGFVFAWTELISHRSFMPTLLRAKDQRGWQILHRLVVNLFQFMEPFLRHETVLQPAILELYKGTLRIVLVLFHDYPEFLSEYYTNICDVLPTSCTQFRNIILSAAPKSLHRPDPFSMSSQLSQLPEKNLSPRLMPAWGIALAYNNLKEYLDELLLPASDRSFPSLQVLVQKLLRNPARPEDVSKYTLPALNAVVLHLGKEAIAVLESDEEKFATVSAFEQIPSNHIFRFLVEDLDVEGRYYFISALVNHLRYPNSHTHFFSRVILYLFSITSSKIVKEQITRVFMERLVANQPHPWGLLVTFIELIRNKNYKFWEQECLECTVEIRQVFDDVARTCLGKLERT